MSRATFRLEEFVQPKPERSHMPLLVENVRAELRLEAVPAKFGEHEVVNLESTKSEVLEASGRQFDEPRGVRFRIFGECHAVKPEVVPPGKLALVALLARRNSPASQQPTTLDATPSAEERRYGQLLGAP